MADGCVICREPLQAQVICAVEKKWHPDCFVCVHCLMPFPEGKFFEQEGKLYCEADYQCLYGNRCGRCGENIVGRCINALDLKWHPEHFTCDECGNQLAGTSFVKRLGRPHCKPCAQKLKQQEAERFKNMCARCKKSIDGEVLHLNKEKFHPHHFSCAMCKKELNSNAKDLDGKLYCPPCYEKATQAACGACHKPIQGRSITALGKLWHPEHFVCGKCEKSFSGSTFYEFQGKPYCEPHFNELTGASCGRCGRPAAGRVITAINRKWCENHFTCIGCEIDITELGLKYFDWDCKPMCKNCYSRLDGDLRKQLAKYNDNEKRVNRAGEKYKAEN